MHMCICTHTHTHACMHARARTHTHTHTHTHAQMYTHSCTHITHWYTRFICLYMCMNVCVQALNGSIQRYEALECPYKQIHYIHLHTTYTCLAYIYMHSNVLHTCLSVSDPAVSDLLRQNLMWSVYLSFSRSNMIVVTKLHNWQHYLYSPTTFSVLLHRA